MLFSSVEFIFAFFPSVLAAYYFVVFLGRLLPFGKRSADGGNNAVPAWSRWVSNLLLCGASLYFYAAGEPKFVWFLIAAALVIWLGALGIAHAKTLMLKRLCLGATVVYNIVILLIFKYLNFAAENIGALFGTAFSLPQIALPIGISFFTFQAISYVADVYRGEGEAQVNPINVALYLAFFPQLIAGPIVRYETVAHEIRHRRENIDDFSVGVCRFVAGMGKKVIIANQLGVVADAAFATEELSVSFAWLGAIAYAFQIYFDFGGYSDMAIGLGRVFGFHFLENFDYPYISASVTEFWRRWHISLGTWFRDYVYIPLGGSRSGSAALRIFNLFCVWALTGLWHGASWNFILWGLMYFVFLQFERVTGLAKRDSSSDIIPVRILRVAGTLGAVLLGWVFFRAEDLSGAVRYLGCMFGVLSSLGADETALNLAAKALPFVAAVVFSLPVYRVLERWYESFYARVSEKNSAGAAALTAAKTIISFAAVVTVFMVSVSYLVKGSYNPFIYFNF